MPDWGLSAQLRSQPIGSSLSQHFGGKGAAKGGGGESWTEHLPPLTFLVDFVNVLFGEAILLRDLEENSRGLLSAAQTGSIPAFYTLTFYFLIIKYTSLLWKNTKKKMTIVYNPVSQRNTSGCTLSRLLATGADFLCATWIDYRTFPRHIACYKPSRITTNP